MQQAYWFGAQFSYAIPNIWPVPFVFDRIINDTLTLNDTSSGSVLHVIGSLKNWELDYTQCFDWRSANITGGASANAHIAPVPWTYINCNYLPGWVSSIRNNSMFPPQDTNGVIPICSHPEWETPLSNYTNQQIIEEYGFTAENIEKIGRILFTQGGLDPKTAVGPPPLALTGYRNESRVVLMPNIGHGEEQFASDFEPKGTSVWADKLREIVLEQIKDWMIEAGK